MTLIRTSRPATALLALLLAAGLGTGASAGDSGSQTSATASGSSAEADKAVVVPYKTRPAPSHRVSLQDERVYFLKKLEKTDTGFVLHTMEDEVIEVEQSEVTEIVEFKTE